MALNFPDSPTVGQTFPSPAQAGVPVWKWDGTEWVPSNLGYLGSTVGIINVQKFTANGTYVPTPGMTFAVADGVGGGGGGGGVLAASGTSYSAGGGGCGARAVKMLTAAMVGAGLAVTIGAGGAAGVGNGAGGAGTATTLGAVLTAAPATGGAQGNAGLIPVGGVGGLASSCVGDLVTDGMCGLPGGYSSASSGVLFVGGQGGSGRWGAGGRGASAASGVSASAPAVTANTGCGGGGAAANNVATPSNGAAGSTGYLVVTEYGVMTAPSTVQITGLIRSYLAGLTMSTPGSSTNMTIAAGLCADTNNGDMISLASPMTKTQAAWAAGTSAGGLDTGTIANSTWYHWYVIKNPTTGAVDVTFSLNAAAPGGAPVAAGFTIARRVGSAVTTAGGNWQFFHQLGDDFLWDVPVTIASSVAFATAAALISAGVPTGVQVNAYGWARADYATNAATMTMSPPDMPAPTVGSTTTSFVVSGTCTNSTNSWNIRTDTSGRIRWQANGTGPTWSGATAGWVDRRGRDA